MGRSLGGLGCSFNNKENGFLIQTRRDRGQQRCQDHTMGARIASLKEGTAESKYPHATIYKPLPSYMKTDTKCIGDLNIILRTRKIQKEMLVN